MTTHDEELDQFQDEKPNRIEWEVTPPVLGPTEIEFYDCLRKLLSIYEPVETEIESDKQFTTAEIIQAVELHYNISQGDPEVKGIDGSKLVDYLTALGFICINTGGLMIQWLMKKKPQQ